ncbi:MAG: hypothetical protein JNL71_06310 [Rhodospirillales bacterium]|nr:hypothetical protein [Rhodospirillales bacterium]
MAQIRTFPQRQARRTDPEPSIAELIEDPLAQILMRRDGVTREALLRTLEAARLRIAAAASAPARCCA